MAAACHCSFFKIFSFAIFQIVLSDKEATEGGEGEEGVGGREGGRGTGRGGRGTGREGDWRGRERGREKCPSAAPNQQRVHFSLSACHTKEAVTNREIDSSMCSQMLLCKYCSWHIALVKLIKDSERIFRNIFLLLVMNFVQKTISQNSHGPNKI